MSLIEFDKHQQNIKLNVWECFWVRQGAVVVENHADVLSGR